MPYTDNVRGFGVAGRLELQRVAEHAERLLAALDSNQFPGTIRDCTESLRSAVEDARIPKRDGADGADVEEILREALRGLKSTTSNAMRSRIAEDVAGFLNGRGAF